MILKKSICALCVIFTTTLFAANASNAGKDKMMQVQPASKTIQPVPPIQSPVVVNVQDSKSHSFESSLSPEELSLFTKITNNRVAFLSSLSQSERGIFKSLHVKISSYNDSMKTQNSTQNPTAIPTVNTLPTTPSA